MKKALCIIFAVLLTFSFSSTACAQDYSRKAPAFHLGEIDIENTNAVYTMEIEENTTYRSGEAAAQYLGNMPIDELVNTGSFGITPYATARLTFSGMSGYDTYHTYTEYLLDGYGAEELYIDICVWVPEESDITVGLWNLATGAQYGIRFSDGQVTDFTITTDNVPGGRYYVYVKNNSSLIINTGYLTFELN